MAAPASDGRNRGGNAEKSPSVAALEDLLDHVDVPAAVVCARCGLSECAGCDEDFSRSGIIAIIAWERSDAPLLQRLWMTARATTRDPEEFFETLPDGPLAPALRFAIVSEVLATSAMLVFFLPVVALLAPHWLKEVTLSGAGLRVLAFGIPAFATLLVMAHAAHGLALDVGARRAGARGARSRALRFGLYATGWDLVIGPLGAVVIAFKEGWSPPSSRKIPPPSPLGMGLPTRSVRAFLRGTYGLFGDDAQRALRTSYLAAIVATAVATVAIVAGILALILF